MQGAKADSNENSHPNKDEIVNNSDDKSSIETPNNITATDVPNDSESSNNIGTEYIEKPDPSDNKEADYTGDADSTDSKKVDSTGDTDSTESKKVDSTKCKENNSTDDKKSDSTDDKKSDSTDDKKSDSSDDKKSDSSDDKKLDSTDDKKSDSTDNGETDPTYNFRKPDPSPSVLKKADLSPSDIKKPDPMDSIREVVDHDDYLLHLEDILTRIHSEFYAQYDRVKDSGGLPDVKEIVPRIRGDALKGCNIVFSGVFPSHADITKVKVINRFLMKINLLNCLRNVKSVIFCSVECFPEVFF